MLLKYNKIMVVIKFNNFLYYVFRYYNTCYREYKDEQYTDFDIREFLIIVLDYFQVRNLFRVK